MAEYVCTSSGVGFLVGEACLVTCAVSILYFWANIALINMFSSKYDISINMLSWLPSAVSLTRLNAQL